MSVYLSLGKDTQGNFHHINSQKSGKGNLTCPFCHCPLIAVKGKTKAAHFRHDGQTCNESLNEIPQIPAWHHFHLNYPLEIIDALKDGYQADSKSPNVFQYWKSGLHRFPRTAKQELFNHDDWTDNLIFTDTARTILGSLPLLGFSQWMRNTLQMRVHTLRQAIEQGTKHRAWLEIEAHRQQAILTASLYLFEYQLTDNTVIHKVGRTSRAPEQRLKETALDLEKATGKALIKSTILRKVENCGHVEKYVFHRYSNQLANIGSHTEYLVLDAKSLKRLKAEFTKLTNNPAPFNKAERFIVTGRWKYEEKRLAASKRGIELTQRESGKFGRPKGSTVSNDDFLIKHSDIVNSLERGRSINQTAEFTGKGRSTVKRVKAAMKK
ncbi:TPA: GIY-YIG nuclease family protein [Vibrio parahaemolyticus]|nr:GIY-YIG nuclease family protein [Vibrio parahaemolyticus]UPR19044.1 GIY-YIG nuclease family protein [Vibrio parahaemolyticus]HAV1520175.1 GIY-YIG nuclease family protein [Vibrio parahaemolyticus]HAV1539141.1 GIY-YIG nuclease family protein [Vibrio parahaemolyticus]